MSKRRRLIIVDGFMGKEIRDAAAPRDAAALVLIKRDNTIDATSVVFLLNTLIEPPRGLALRCDGSGSRNVSGIKGPGRCVACGQEFQPPDDQSGPWKPWKLPEHDQPTT